MRKPDLLAAVGARHWLQLLCALALVLPYPIALVLGDYVPNFDEAFQLEAAVRLVDGEGYAASRVIPKDLSGPDITYLVQWPIGHSMALSGFLKIGVSLELSAKLLKLLALGLAIVTWQRLAIRYLRDPAARTIFFAFVSFYAVICAASTTDLIVFALFAVLSALILHPEQARAARVHGLATESRSLVLAGVTAGAAVFVKYSALPFAFLGSAWLAWRNRKQPRKLALEVMLFGVPAGAIIAAIFLVNLATAGQLSTFSERLVRTPAWHIEWLLETFMGILFAAPYLPKIIVKLFFAPQGPLYESVATYLIVGSMAILLLASLVRLLRSSERERDLALWLAGACACAVLFLGLITSIYFGLGESTPMLERRYYQWIVPVMAICVLSAASSVFPSHSPAYRRSMGILQASALAGFLFLSLAYSIHVYREMNSLTSEARNSHEELKVIVARESAPALVVFADSDNFRSFPEKGKINVFPAFQVLSTGHIFPKGSYFSRPTIVAMVCSRATLQFGPYHENSCVNGEFESLAKRFAFNKIQTGESNTIYWRVFLEGPAPALE